VVLIEVLKALCTELAAVLTEASALVARETSDDKLVDRVAVLVETLEARVEMVVSRLVARETSVETLVVRLTTAVDREVETEARLLLAAVLTAASRPVARVTSAERLLVTEARLLLRAMTVETRPATSKLATLPAEEFQYCRPMAAAVMLRVELLELALNVVVSVAGITQVEMVGSSSKGGWQGFWAVGCGEFCVRREELVWDLGSFRRLKRPA
jgi:hypothetical protein